MNEINDKTIYEALILDLDNSQSGTMFNSGGILNNSNAWYYNTIAKIAFQNMVTQSTKKPTVCFRCSWSETILMGDNAIEAIEKVKKTGISLSG